MEHERDYDPSMNSLDGLGSSHSCLDGVPFRIGSKFRPPEKVHIPPELLAVSRSLLLDEHYSFETEEGVLAWIRAKEETRRLQKAEAEERRAKEIEEFARAAETDLDSDDEPVLSSGLDSSSLNPVDHPPVVSHFNSILTPTPIQINTYSSFSSDTKKVSDIDLSLFEKEKDAFENLDLQTINDMEELKNLFPDTQVFEVNPIENINETNIDKLRSNMSVAVVKEPVDKPKASSVQLVDEGDYVNLQVEFNQSCIMFSNTIKDSDNMATTNSLADQLPSNIANHKPLLPPMVSLSKTGSKPVLNGLNDVNQQIVTVSVTSQCEQTALYSSSHIPHAETSEFSPNILYENVSEVRIHGAKSNPDLSAAPQHNVSSRFSISHTPPPVSCIPVEDSPVYQNWNLNQKPIPFIPPVTPKLNPKCSILSSNTSAETDLYSTLSIQDQQFVNKLGTMGFPRTRASRAVAKLGQNEKEVIDHLCHVDSLISKGYHPLRCESALYLFDNNISKASNYIDMYSQFQELGFHADKIREALIKNDVDRDKTLDELMSS